MKVIHLIRFSLVIGIFVAYMITYTSCNIDKSQTNFAADSAALTFPKVYAKIETQPVSVAHDAADDPCIWINKLDSSRSLIIGTNKKEGLEVYNMRGQLVQNFPVGRLNNVDIRYNVPFGGDTVDVIVATNRTHNSLSVFTINQQFMHVKNVSNTDLMSQVEEVYGFALGKSVSTHQLFAFVVGKDGTFEQWELNGETGKFTGEIVRTHKFNTICEGIVADDFNQKVFVAEENVGIWKMDMAPKATQKPTQIAEVNKVELMDDLEGMAIYYADSTTGYLLASVQGSNSYAIFERQTPHQYLGSFTVTDSNGIDGVQETDGLDVTNQAVMGFPNGLFIAQDGFNMNNGTLVNQNFKLVDWQQIANAFTPALKVNPDFNKSF